jgi:hypothetical protein
MSARPDIQASRGRAAASTVEALLYSLRAGGAALDCPHARRRLAELSEAQLHEVSARLQKIQPNIAGHGRPLKRRCWSLSGLIYMDKQTQASIDALKRIRGKMQAERASGQATDGARPSTNSGPDQPSVGAWPEPATAEWVGARRALQLGIHAGCARTMD